MIVRFSEPECTQIVYLNKDFKCRSSRSVSFQVLNKVFVEENKFLEEEHKKVMNLKNKELEIMREKLDLKNQELMLKDKELSLKQEQLQTVQYGYLKYRKFYNTLLKDMGQKSGSSSEISEISLRGAISGQSSVDENLFPPPSTPQNPEEEEEVNEEFIAEDNH